MKRNIHLFILGMVSGLTLFSCKKEAIDRFPKDNITDLNFWKTENDLKLYVNSFYPVYVVGFGSEWADATAQPFGVNVGTLVYGDLVTDNAAPNTYSKVGTDEYINY